MKRLMMLLLSLLLALPAMAEEPPTPTPAPVSDSIAEGYVAPATPTPAPTPELPPLREDPMLQNIVEIAHRIDLLSESRLFRANYISHAVTDDMIEDVAYGDHSRPVRAFHMSGQQMIDALQGGVEPSQRLDFTRSELLRDLVDELPELLWGTRSDAERHVLTVLWRYKVFAAPGAQGCGVFFLLYEEASPVMITWMAQSDCVKVSACFMPDAALAAVRDVQGMADWFAGKGMPTVTFEEVPLT